jgi:prophage antirepressor-like protein
MCPNCFGFDFVKVISSPFFLRTPIESRYNPAVGKAIRNKRQLTDELKRASEERTLKTGIVHDYAPVDLRDKEALGVTDEGLYETAKRQTDEGQREVRRWL